MADDLKYIENKALEIENLPPEQNIRGTDQVIKE